MAMRAQRRTVIDPMYIEDADVMNVLKLIMDGPEGLTIGTFMLQSRTSRIEIRGIRQAHKIKFRKKVVIKRCINVKCRKDYYGASKIRKVG